MGNCKLGHFLNWNITWNRKFGLKLYQTKCTYCTGCLPERFLTLQIKRQEHHTWKKWYAIFLFHRSYKYLKRKAEKKVPILSKNQSKVKFLRLTIPITGRHSIISRFRGLIKQNIMGKFKLYYQKIGHKLYLICQ